MYKVLGVGAFYSVSDSASGRRELLGVVYSSIVYLLCFTLLTIAREGGLILIT